MFTLQPLVARLLLPVMGGSPAVWNTCMVFFQAVLLAGYAYAHAIDGLASRRGRAAVIVHGLVLLLPVIALPLSLPAWAADVPREGGQAWWVLLVLAAVAGLPMFAVSATAPLAQRLLAGAQHSSSTKPYFLYAASNAGSLLALLAYPVLIEPTFGLRMQGWGWAGAYAAFVTLVTTSVAAVARVGFRGTDADAARSIAAEADADETARWRQRAWWLALAAAPSSLLLGVTNYLSTDVAAIPLLWVLPLAVYLCTFIIAFSERARAGVGPRVATLMLPLIVLSVALTMRVGYALGVALVQQVLLLFVGSLACHVELARRAPSASRLTEFYLYVSLGGVIGGVFNSLVAPVVFNSVLEYPVAVIAVSFLAMIGAAGARRQWMQRPMPHVAIGLLIGGAAAGVAIGIRAAVDAYFIVDERVLRLVSFAPGLIAAFLLRSRPEWFVLVLAALFAVAWNQPLRGDEGGGRELHAARTFFGVHRVNEAPSGRFHTLTHGTTVHGLQFVTDELRTMPTMYYHPTGPIGHVFASMSLGNGPRRVAVVGLGAGALAAYAAPGSPVKSMEFYEIDAEVVRIASDPRLFTYLADASRAREIAGDPVEFRHILGDGRLELAQTEALYNLIVLDAFSSDAIPVHLLTSEAFGVYLSRLAPGGIIAVHISNRHIDLVPVVQAGAAANGLTAVFVVDPLPPEELRLQGKVGSHWAAVARSRDDLRVLDVTPGMAWTESGEPASEPWTDDWSDVVSRLRVWK